MYVLNRHAASHVRMLRKRQVVKFWDQLPSAIMEPHFVYSNNNPSCAVGNSSGSFWLSAQLWHMGFGGTSRRMYRLHSQSENALTASMTTVLYSVMSVYWMKRKAFSLTAFPTNSFHHGVGMQRTHGNPAWPMTIPSVSRSVQPMAMVLVVSTLSYIFNSIIAIESGISIQACISPSSFAFWDYKR